MWGVSGCMRCRWFAASGSTAGWWLGARVLVGVNR